VPPPPVQTAPAPVAAAPAAGPDACAACAKAVDGGDFATAARSYVGCSDARAKARCQKLAGKEAPGLAKAAAFNGKCNEARAIILAAKQMGVPASQFRDAEAECNK
jgi:hypothetical protein